MILSCSLLFVFYFFDMSHIGMLYSISYNTNIFSSLLSSNLWLFLLIFKHGGLFSHMFGKFVCF